MCFFTVERQLMDRADLLDKRHFNKDTNDTKDIVVFLNLLILHNMTDLTFRLWEVRYILLHYLLKIKNCEADFQLQYSVKNVFVMANHDRWCCCILMYQWSNKYTDNRRFGKSCRILGFLSFVSCHFGWICVSFIDALIVNI